MLRHRHPRADDSDERLTDKPLRRDVRMLGWELGRLLRRLSGERMYRLVERVRALAKRRRDGDDAADHELRSLIGGLELDDLAYVIRALAVYFDLSNLAEDRHRIRVLRERERQGRPERSRQSLRDAVGRLAETLDGEQLRSLLDHLRIELVFTAHPTEAKRRTVRDTLRRLRNDLSELDREDLLRPERKDLIRRIRTDLACLWETDPVPPRRPTVLEEVGRGRYAAEGLWNVVPAIYRSLREAIGRLPERTLTAQPFLRFGTWIGGDRDGNPLVTADVTRKTLELMRASAIGGHLRECERLSEVLSISERGHTASTEIRTGLADAEQRWSGVRSLLEPISSKEIYRRWLKVIEYRLRRTLDSPPDRPPLDAAYRSPQELNEDIRRMADSLRAEGYSGLVDVDLDAWMDRVHTFGFHMAGLDVRDNSARLHEGVDHIASAAGLCDNYADLSSEDRAAFLVRPVDPQDVESLRPSDLPSPADDMLRLFDHLARVAVADGAQSLGALVVSMTHRPADVLAMLWCARLGAARIRRPEAADAMPVTPLFETIDDLARAGELFDHLLQLSAFRGHVHRSGGVALCMVGYSDSTKDGGYLSAHWYLHRAQQDLAAVARRHGVGLMLFHGRGGALGRGGGPAARGIRSLPPESVRGRIRMTEQGEVLAERYDDPAIATRHITQVTWATLLVSAEPPQPPDPAADELVARAAERAQAAYRRLVTDPAFVGYFRRATPIDTIETLQIGSRPSRRRGQQSLADMRAIPYTFAWTQNRHLITGFYGLGSGLEPELEADPERLRTLYQQWPFFQAMIDNAELALAKADPRIAGEYAALAPGGAKGRIATMIREEHKRTTRVVLGITGRNHLLEHVPWLRRSIDVRNPYVDPLNLIQVELMRRAAEVDPERDPERATRIDELLRLSIKGIASGMRNTG